MDLGEILKELRTENGYTQKQVAEVLKVGRATISGYETKGIYPDYEKLIVLADLFNCSTDYLLGRVSSPKKLSNEQIFLLDKIVELLISNGIIDSSDKLTEENIRTICKELKTAFSTIELLRNVKKSGK